MNDHNEKRSRKSTVAGNVCVCAHWSVQVSVCIRFQLLCIGIQNSTGRYNYTDRQTHMSRRVAIME